MKTTTAEFHTMRGHVQHGCVVVSPSGKEFTIKSTMKGWMVHANDDGLAVSGNLPSAFDVEFFVVNGLSAR